MLLHAHQLYGSTILCDPSIRLIVMTRDLNLTQVPKLQTIYNLTTLKPPIIIPDISPTDEDLGDTATSSDSDRTDTEVTGDNDNTDDDSE